MGSPARKFDRKVLMSFTPKQLKEISGYLESVENLATVGRMLIDDGHGDLVATILEELYEDAQAIMLHCVEREK